MSTIMSTGQITIVDLTDSRGSSFYLQANRSKVQTYDTNTQVFSPDYTKDNVNITPTFFFGNEDYSSKIDPEDISYYINTNETPATKFSASEEPTGSYYQLGTVLIIKENIGSSSLAGTTLRIRAVIGAGAITDEKTGLANSQIEAVIEFARVDGGGAGPKGISVTGVEQQYFLSSSSSELKDASEGTTGWRAEPYTWKENTYLWFRTKVSYSEGDPTYTKAYCDSSWKAASDGVVTLTERLDNADELIKQLQNEVDSVIETWFLEGVPSVSSPPWEDSAQNDYHVGDLYYDTASGKSYRFYKDGENFTWTELADNDISATLQQVIALQTEVDGKVSVYYGEDPGVANVKVDDLWVDSDGNFHRCEEVADEQGNVTKQWSLASYSVETITIQYAQSNSNTTPPASDSEAWKPEAPTWAEGMYVWQRTVTTYKGAVQAEEYSNPVCISAAAARSITISGEQVFKSTDGETYSPASITLTANCFGGLQMGEWYYKNTSGTWSTLKAPSTEAGIEITPDEDAFNNGTVATIKVTALDAPSYYDIISIYKVTDGQKGSDGSSPSSVFLTNENITFAANEKGEVAATTVTCNVVAYTGTTKVTPVVGTITQSSASGMSVTKKGTVNNEGVIQITIADKATLGSAGATSGIISIPVTSPVSTTLQIAWSKVNAGSIGESAVFGIVESQSGRVVFTDSDNGDITLEAKLYVGGTVETDTTKVSYNWTCIPASSSISGTANTLVVSRDKVPSARSFVCTMTYNGETYKDSIALSDKTDAIYCVIESSGGDKFTNSNISSTLKCRLFNGYGEVDAGGTTYTYTWEKYVNGEKVEDWRESGSVAGKTLAITAEDVDAKATFSCAVTK